MSTTTPSHTPTQPPSPQRPAAPDRPESPGADYRDPPAPEPQPARPSVYPRLAMYPLGQRRGDGPVFQDLAAEPEPDANTWGICLSGGGIRSAAFSLGAIQEMHRHDMICGDHKATYLAAVSGGGYLAAALTSLAQDPNDVTGKQATPPDPGPDLLPFAAGSPEDRYLRDRARYLTHGRGGPSAAIASYVLGVTLNLVILFGTVYVLSRSVGWIYGQFFPQFRRNYTESSCLRAAAGHAVSCTVVHVVTALPDWAIALTAAMVAVAVAAGLLWSSDAKSIRSHPKGHLLAVGAWLTLGAAAVLAFLLVGIPHMLQFLRVDLPRLGVGTTPTGTAQAVSGKATRQAGATLSWGALAAFAGTLATGLSGLVASAKSLDSNLTKQASSFTKRLLTRFRRPIVHAAEWLFAPLLFLFVALAAIVWGAGMPPWQHGACIWWDLVAWWLAPAVIVAALWKWGNITAWSPHSFYRDRLGAAFNLEWRTADNAAPSPTAIAWRRGRLDVAPRATSPPIDKMQPANTPELLVCAAANLSDYGAAPTGSRVSSFVMSSQWVGGPAVGAMPAKEYVDRTTKHHRRIDLLTATAISGGAVAPAMGRMTRTSLQKLLTLANVRLGVWLPNPRWVADGSSLTAKSHFRYRATPTYLVRELLGRNRSDAKFIYVSDGGHYENLGLVELLRHRCRWIWCCDAAGGGPDTFTTIGQALALANAELGITITGFRPEEQIAPDPNDAATRISAGKPPLAKATFCVGTITYPDTTETGTLVYIKTSVTAETPWEVRAFQENNPTFPFDPTSNQLYTAERVDAYRALGTWATQQAWAAMGDDFDQFRHQPQDANQEGHHA